MRYLSWCGQEDLNSPQRRQLFCCFPTHPRLLMCNTRCVLLWSVRLAFSHTMHRRHPDGFLSHAQGCLQNGHGLELSTAQAGAYRLFGFIVPAHVQYAMRIAMERSPAFLIPCTEGTRMGAFCAWCGQEDLNLHGVAPIRT